MIGVTRKWSVCAKFSSQHSYLCKVIKLNLPCYFSVVKLVIQEIRLCTEAQADLYRPFSLISSSLKVILFTVFSYSSHLYFNLISFFPVKTRK